jgi:hygromycin-B 7''-O-kinase
MLPDIRSVDAYRSIYRDPQAWLPALHAICRRTGLQAATLQMAPPGSHIVFWVEDDKLIKLYAPFWVDDADRESLVLRTLAGKSELNVPRLLAAGDLDGWPYLVLTRLPGVPLDSIWETLTADERIQLSASLGVLMANLHRLPTSGLEILDIDFPAFLSRQIETCVERQCTAGVAVAWLARIGDFLEELSPLLEPNYQPVLLHADLNPEHLFCEQSQAGWRITGLIDFGDAMLGHPYYEFVDPGFILKNSPPLRRSMLLAYGMAPYQLDENLSRRLLAFTLLHRFATLPDWLALFDEHPPVDLLALKDALWDF